MAYRRRALAGTIRRALRTFPAVLVTGSRQSGKTTLLREEFETRRRYVSLERPEIRARALADPEAFLADHPTPLILDEIQHAPALLSHLKERIDENRRPGRWLLTGSQTFPLMRGITETLAGRIAVLHLDPLSSAEASGALPRESLEGLLARVFGRGSATLRPAKSAAARLDLPDWLLRGGYPEPCLNRRVDRQLWFSSYVQTYLERDVRDLVQVGDLAGFSRFLFLLATRTGTILNLSDVGRDAGVTGVTAKRWLSVLETSGLVYLLRPYHRNLGKRVVKSPKLYFTDVGLATFLLGLHSREAIMQGPSLGALVETAVVSEWLKAFRCRGLQPSLYYWRSGAGLEVDLVIEHDGQLYGLEIKATSTPTPLHAESLARWLDLAGPRTRGAVACRVAGPVGLLAGIRAVPWDLSSRT